VEQPPPDGLGGVCCVRRGVVARVTPTVAGKSGHASLQPWESGGETLEV